MIYGCMRIYFFSVRCVMYQKVLTGGPFDCQWIQTHMETTMTSLSFFNEFSAEINQNEIFCAIFGSGSTWNLFDWAFVDTYI
jgi:hypothetical protein